MTPLPSPKKPVVADLKFAPESPEAEIHTSASTIEVCIAHPSLEPRDAEIRVTPFSLRFSRRGDERLLVYALPVAAEAGRFIVRHQNGVYSILIARAARSR